MVQTKDQYVFVYKAILDLVQELLSAMKDEQPEQSTWTGAGALAPSSAPPGPACSSFPLPL